MSFFKRALRCLTKTFARLRRDRFPAGPPEPIPAAQNTGDWNNFFSDAVSLYGDEDEYFPEEMGDEEQLLIDDIKKHLAEKKHRWLCSEFPLADCSY
jgi:hypothetical protein